MELANTNANLVNVSVHDDYLTTDVMQLTNAMTTFSPLFTQSDVNKTLALPTLSAFAIQANYFSNTIFLPIVLVIGIVGNILNLVVLSRKSMSSSTSLFLRGLAVSDLMMMLNLVPGSLYSIDALKNDYDYELFYRYYCVFRYMFANFCITSTSWLTMAVTLERFIAIRYTLKVRLICTTKRARIAIATIFILSFLFHLSKFFEYEPNTDLTSKRQYLMTELGRSPVYNKLLHYTNISVAVWIPTLFLTVFNILLIYFLAKHNKNKRQLGTNAAKKVSETRRVTVVVIAMVFVFILCHACGALLAVMIAVYGKKQILLVDPFFSGLRHISNLMVSVNSGVNFILYCGLSKKFRDEFRTVFCCCAKATPAKKPASAATSTRSTTSGSSLRNMGSRMHQLESSRNDSTRI